MPVEIKNYIEYVGYESVFGNYEGVKGHPVELPDFSKATDLEKLEWVLNEIGVDCFIGKVDNITTCTTVCPNNYKVVSGENLDYELPIFLEFDINGRLIK